MILDVMGAGVLVGQVVPGKAAEENIPVNQVVVGRDSVPVCCRIDTTSDMVFRLPRGNLVEITVVVEVGKLL